MPDAWSWTYIGNGISDYTLTQWRGFHEVIEDALPSASKYVWRGQRRDDWHLEPSLDRELRRLVPRPLELAPIWPPMHERRRDELRREHLEAFQFAVRGRRGTNPGELTNDQWWALGQHYGLKTPLLDWTKSPYAAAFFAFHDEGDETPTRMVYGLNRTAIEHRTNFLSLNTVEAGRPPIIEFVSPLSDDNPRLVSQGGLFTRAPNDMTIEDWVEAAFRDEDPGEDDDDEQMRDDASPILVRVRIPNTERQPCLRGLNRMNINHLSLFPDLQGAAQFSNLSLRIQDY